MAEPSPELLGAAVDGALDLLVADADGPAGYALLLDAGDAALLLELAVEPDRQGEGLGSTLLEETCSRLGRAGAATVRLTARASDERVLAFYEDHGFEREKRLPEYFESGDAVLLSREL